MSRALEEAQERARLAAAEVEAPPCPACRRPVTDEDWEAHRRLDHGLDEPRPYGRPASREALFVADTREELDQQIARWRERHPGLGLQAMGEGRDREAGVTFVRFRVLDRQGRPAE